jgi:Raf kinase inhibitor-like YbhB/YbcL family protein
MFSLDHYHDITDHRYVGYTFGIANIVGALRPWKLGEASVRRNRVMTQRVATARLRFVILALLAAFASEARAFDLMSPDVKADQPMPERFTFNGLGCNGQNISPGLSWTDPPEGTNSFALMVHDPDAVTGGAGIWHWVVVNIPASSRSIAEGAGTADGAKLPPGSRQITNDYAGFINSSGWGGPCPPKGAKPHSYNFTLYALKAETLNLPANATSSHAGFVVNLNALDKAKLTMTYGR